MFDKISSTAGLFLALEPQVFVSRIRCRIFRNWKAAEEYYANSLRELKNYFSNVPALDIEFDDAEDEDEALPNGGSAVTSGPAA